MGIVRQIHFFNAILLLTLLSLTYWIGSNYNYINLFIASTIFCSILLHWRSQALSLLYNVMVYIDPFSLFIFDLPRIIPLLLCFIPLIINLNFFIRKLNEDRYLRKLFAVSLIFLMYQIIFTFGLLEATPFKNIIRNNGFLLSYFIFIPSYIVFTKDNRSFIFSIFSLSFYFSIAYLLSTFTDIDFYNVSQSLRLENSDIMRIDGAYLPQITKIFIIALPTIFIINNLKLRITIAFIGFSALAFLLLALFRNETFYTVCGTLFCLMLLRKKFKLKWKSIIFPSVIMLAIILIFFYDLIINMYLTYASTFEYFNKKQNDLSADIRLLNEIPYLVDLFKNNPILGSGYNIAAGGNQSYYYISDIPLLGNLAAYGILGLLLYFFKYVIIFRAYSSVRIVSNHLAIKWELVAIIVLFAYFFTSITFRNTYIFAELALPKMLIEFGLFSGIFLSILQGLKFNIPRRIETKSFSHNRTTSY